MSRTIHGPSGAVWHTAGIFADPHGLDRLIEWKFNSVGHRRQFGPEPTEEQKMQRQYTIELRVDFADSEKLEPLKQVLQQAARHAFATAQLLSDNPKTTQVAIFSDDFFSGKEEIALLDDVIGQGLESVGEAQAGDTPSDELMAAMRE